MKIIVSKLLGSVTLDFVRSGPSKFKHTPLSRVPLCVSWAFVLVFLVPIGPSQQQFLVRFMLKKTVFFLLSSSSAATAAVAAVMSLSA